MILFIDTSKLETHIALYDSENLKAEKIWFSAKNQSEELLSEIDKMLKSIKLSKFDIEKIIAVVGPGSYTGLRVGLSTANALALALNIEVVGIDTDYSPRQIKNYLKTNSGKFESAILPKYPHQPKITTPNSGRKSK